MMIIILKSISEVDSNNAASNEVVNKEDKRFHFSSKLEYYAQ